MIELIYNEEEVKTAEEGTLPEPKNVKQMGQPKEFKKIFLEDFVHTFLLQYGQGAEQNIRIAILLGNSERSGGKRYLYIKSVLPVEDVTEKQGKYHFTEKVWGTIYQECEKYFPKQEILGWFLSRPGFAVEKNAVTEETHRTYFSGADKLLFMMEPLDGESAFFGFDGNRFTKQSGYYIYYEKNEAMREFMMNRKEEQKKTSGSESPDLAMANFRKILKEKQQKNEKRKKRAISYGAKLAMLLVLFAGAVVFKNQTDKIARMEQQLGAAIEQKQDSGPVQEAVSEQVVVEELPGEVEELPVTGEEEPQQPTEELPTEAPEPVDEKSADEESEVQEEPIKETVAPVYEEYTVQAGDTLVGICRSIYGTDDKVSEICELNEISDGDYIQAGEIILLPQS